MHGGNQAKCVNMNVKVFSCLALLSFSATFRISINHVQLLSTSLLTIENTIQKSPAFPSFIAMISNVPLYVLSRCVLSTYNKGQLYCMKPCNNELNEKNALLKWPLSLSMCTMLSPLVANTFLVYYDNIPQLAMAEPCIMSLSASSHLHSSLYGNTTATS